MALGTLFAAYVGPQTIFIYVGFLSALGIFLAFFLRELDEIETPVSQHSKKFSIPKPTSIDGLIFWMGFGIDGVFTITIALMWVQYSSPETAIIIGGLILAVRRISEMIVAPLAGRISDHFGATLPLLSMLGSLWCWVFADWHRKSYSWLSGISSLPRRTWDLISNSCGKNLPRRCNVSIY
jgi:predicted MFS family arabinose efflux permease